MKRGVHWIRLLPTLALVLACGASALAADDVYPFDRYERLGAVHKIVQDVDQASFAQAIGEYPTAGGGYSVDFGPYMMWQIVSLFESGARVEGLRLAKYVQRCRTVQAVASNSVSCAYDSELVVRVGGQEHRSRYRADGDVGRPYSSYTFCEY